MANNLENKIEEIVKEIIEMPKEREIKLKTLFKTEKGSKPYEDHYWSKGKNFPKSNNIKMFGKETEEGDFRVFYNLETGKKLSEIVGGIHQYQEICGAENIKGVLSIETPILIRDQELPIYYDASTGKEAFRANEALEQLEEKEIIFAFGKNAFIQDSNTKYVYDLKTGERLYRADYVFKGPTIYSTNEDFLVQGEGKKEHKFLIDLKTGKTKHDLKNILTDSQQFIKNVVLGNAYGNQMILLGVKRNSGNTRVDIKRERIWYDLNSKKEYKYDPLIHPNIGNNIYFHNNKAFFSYDDSKFSGYGNSSDGGRTVYEMKSGKKIVFESIPGKYKSWFNKYSNGKQTVILESGLSYDDTSYGPNVIDIESGEQKYPLDQGIISVVPTKDSIWGIGKDKRTIYDLTKDKQTSYRTDKQIVDIIPTKNNILFQSENQREYYTVDNLEDTKNKRIDKFVNKISNLISQYKNNK